MLSFLSFIVLEYIHVFPLANYMLLQIILHYATLIFQNNAEVVVCHQLTVSGSIIGLSTNVTHRNLKVFYSNVPTILIRTDASLVSAEGSCKGPSGEEEI